MILTLMCRRLTHFQFKHFSMYAREKKRLSLRVIFDFRLSNNNISDNIGLCIYDMQTCRLFNNCKLLSEIAITAENV